MQRRERLITEIEKLQGVHRNKNGEFTYGLRQVETEIQEVEKSLFDLRVEREEKTAEAAKTGEDMDKIIADFEKRISAKRTHLQTLTIKRTALQSAIAAKQEEFARWELKKFEEYEETLPARYLKAIKLRDQKEAEFNAAQREVENIQFLKSDTRRKIDNIKKELRGSQPALSPEEREAMAEESAYKQRCAHVYRQIDTEIYQLLQDIGDHGKRLEKLRALRGSHVKMINKYPFPWPLQRPPERPDPFEGFSDSEICALEFADAVVLRDGTEEEKAKLRKKYLGRVKVEEDRDLKRYTPAPRMSG